MAKVKLVPPEKLQKLAGTLPGEAMSGRVETWLGISAGFPLHAGFRHLDPGAAVQWTDAASGYIVYLWEGAARIGEVALEPGSVVLIEHGASARIAAEAAGAKLLVFDAADDRPPADAAGGHVHVLPAERVQRAHTYLPNVPVGAAIFADATCPTCRLWLHENTYHEPHFKLNLHSHSQDEIIVVTQGEMVVAGRAYGRGTMLAVGKDVLYSLAVGDGPMEFINFRPSRPTFTSADRTRTIDEASLYRDAFHVPPPYIELASLADQTT
jgi:hypothetical protein